MARSPLVVEGIGRVDIPPTIENAISDGTASPGEIDAAIADAAAKPATTVTHVGQSRFTESVRIDVVARAACT